MFHGNGLGPARSLTRSSDDRLRKGQVSVLSTAPPSLHAPHPASLLGGGLQFGGVLGRCLRAAALLQPVPHNRSSGRDEFEEGTRFFSLFVLNAPVRYAPSASPGGGRIWDVSVLLKKRRAPLSRVPSYEVRDEQGVKARLVRVCRVCSTAPCAKRATAASSLRGCNAILGRSCSC